MHAHRRSPGAESGVSLVEILVVLLIIAVISTVAFMSVGGARTSGGRLEASAAGARYGDAIDRYQQEHGRKLPVIGSTDWPTAAEGPVHRLEIGSSAPIVRPYLKGGVAPELMSKVGPAGAQLVAATGGCPAPVTQGGTLVYRIGPAGASACGPALGSAHQYSIRVFWNGEFICDVGDAAGNRRC